MIESIRRGDPTASNENHLRSRYLNYALEYQICNNPPPRKLGTPLKGGTRGSCPL